MGKAYIIGTGPGDEELLTIKAVKVLEKCTAVLYDRLVSNNILNRNYEKAKEFALLYRDIFGENNFYLELQDHHLPEQKEVNAGLVKLSKETGIPLVATNDLHYVNKEDAKTHDVLMCIQMGKTLNDPIRMRV